MAAAAGAGRPRRPCRRPARGPSGARVRCSCAALCAPSRGGPLVRGAGLVRGPLVRGPLVRGPLVRGPLVRGPRARPLGAAPSCAAPSRAAPSPEACSGSLIRLLSRRSPPARATAPGRGRAAHSAGPNLVLVWPPREPDRRGDGCLWRSTASTWNWPRPCAAGWRGTARGRPSGRRRTARAPRRPTRPGTWRSSRPAWARRDCSACTCRRTAAARATGSPSWPSPSRSSAGPWSPAASCRPCWPARCWRPPGWMAAASCWPPWPTGPGPPRCPWRRG